MNVIETSADGWMELLAPAKVNLMLSVHGRRGDGFHELTSIIAAVGFGDRLQLRIGQGADTLECEGGELPLDDSNLVLRAAKCFREATGCAEHFDFRLDKRIPVGAGLGGGSSDAVAALKGMNVCVDAGLTADQLRALAARIGSDCPFFVDARPSIMRGRGECIEPLPEEACRRLVGQRLALFKPEFGVSTAWAYRRLAAMPELYESESSAAARIEAFLKTGDYDRILHNVFEPAIGSKYLALAALLGNLRGEAYHCLMSGSGSACFARIEDETLAARLRGICVDCWGASIFWVETFIDG